MTKLVGVILAGNIFVAPKCQPDITDGCRSTKDSNIMTKPTLLVICKTTQKMLTDLEPHFDMVDLASVEHPMDALARRGSEITYALTDGHLGVRPDYLAHLPNLAAISCYGVGYDNVDTAYAVKNGIQVSHTPDVLNDDVATLGVMLYLACYRNFVAEAANAMGGTWARNGNLPLSRTAENRRVGILGLGRIGTTLARKLEVFGAQISYHSRSQKGDCPYPYFADLTEMAGSVDALICVAPGGAGTHHLINQEVLEALGPEGVLINIGRGSVVDEAALITALQTGKLGWAGLDVFEEEPNIPDVLRSLPNVVLTPHIASATVETRWAMGDLAVENLITHLKTGRMKTLVPESVGAMDQA
jgi:lactate dehydrogenase-like 2-hydroxyacid dehydrogenase